MSRKAPASSRAHKTIQKEISNELHLDNTALIARSPDPEALSDDRFLSYFLNTVGLSGDDQASALSYIVSNHGDTMKRAEAYAHGKEETVYGILTRMLEERALGVFGKSAEDWAEDQRLEVRGRMGGLHGKTKTRVELGDFTADERGQLSTLIEAYLKLGDSSTASL